jgi:NAD(P)H-nitrite reductase large subunit
MGTKLCVKRSVENKLLTIADVLQIHGMENTQRLCFTCRPAVNYYLISSWPKEAKDDPQSRFVNERSHANIQKDGTYSVIPRMWGGETTVIRAAPHCGRSGQIQNPHCQSHWRSAH